MANETENIKPKFRYGLKSRIIEAGHRDLTDFSNKANIDLTRLSRIVRGWELPGPGLQRKMAQHLGITLTELKELLK